MAQRIHMEWNTLPRPIVALAPMADMTDGPFCRVCKEHGAPVIFREMVSSEALVRGNEKTLKMCEFTEIERPIVQQIFGSNPTVMAEAARIVEERFQPDAIDVNMGCPVHNLTSNFNGASLMREPELAAAIIQAMKAAIRVPLSVKTRLGWTRDTDILEFVKVLEAAGADLITIHGRTKEQGYSGKANWDRVGEARRNTKLPVLVNGDVTSLETARQALSQSGADGVLIGRGALGNPWIFQRLVAGLSSSPQGLGLPPESDATHNASPSLEERLATVRRHAELHVERYGERGLVKLRKHLPWYFKGMPELRDIKSTLVRVCTLEELNAILNSIPHPA